MPRYIDADKLAEHKFSYVTYDRYVSDGRRKSEEEIYAYKVGYNAAIEEIAQFAPTACEEGVRCKDCGWYYMDECINPCGLMNVTEESYCSWAKRREEA